MPDVVDQVAELTRYRDRERLDVTLVGALRELLQPRSIAIWGCVGDAGRPQHWLLRARLSAGDAVAQSDSLWADVRSLEPLDAQPRRLECLRSQGFQSHAGSPAVSCFALGAEAVATGVLEIESELPLDMQAQRLVSSFLRIYHNFQALLDYSERDTLTGLLNRKTFDESFLKVAIEPVAASASEGDGRRRTQAAQRVFLGVIDIDHFKSVNDRYGHLIGDEVLLLLARLMTQTFRFSDRLYRFGGEEFVVLMRCVDSDDAMRAFCRLRENTERYPFPQLGRLTVSIGFTEIKPTDSPSSAFERADKAVYHAKQNGRNQVHDHAALSAAGAVSNGAKTGDIELF